MNYVKHLVGIVCALGAVLVFAWVMAIYTNIDFKWYNSLDKPLYLPNSFGFTVLVCVVYLTHVLLISRLIRQRTFFPDFIFLFLEGCLAAGFSIGFFTFHLVYLSTAFVGVLALLSVFLCARWFVKDVRCALLYLFTLAFNLFSFVVAVQIAVAN